MVHLRRFKPKIPNPECEKLFEESFDAILTHYHSSVKGLASNPASFVNVDLDTGEETVIGEYKLADKSYYKLLMELEKARFAGLKKNLMNYYARRAGAGAFA